MTNASFVSLVERVTRKTNSEPAEQLVVELVMTDANEPVVTRPLAVVENELVTLTGVPKVMPIGATLAARHAPATENVAEPEVCAA